MKPTLPLLLLLGILASCNQYQYLAVSGENASKNETRALIEENDTLRISYRFTDGESQVHINIYNKTNVPIEVNWQKSALVYNDKSFSYHNPVHELHATVQDYNLGRPEPYNESSVSGIITASQAVQFIPPGAFVDQTVKNIPIKLKDYKSQTIVERSAYNSETGEPIRFKELRFPKNQAPASFRSFLTYTIGQGDDAKTFNVNHQFYISSAWKSNSGPAGFSSELAKRGDIFYYKL